MSKKCVSNGIFVHSQFGDARTNMATFLKDKDLRRAYRDNIAMLLYDNQYQMCPKTKSVRRLNFRDKNTRDTVAENILNLIFN